MHSRSRPYQFASWMAVLVMVLNALWPLVAHARPAGAAGMVEVCTAQGVKFVPGSSESPADQGGNAGKHLQPHCPLCSMGGEKPVLGPLTVPPMAIVDLPRLAIPVTLTGIQPGHLLHSRAHPRAPPASL